MNEFAELTKRESEIAELFAWGASKKRHCHPTLYFGTDGGKPYPKHIRKGRVFQSQ